jgi:hypothetical protein
MCRITTGKAWLRLLALSLALFGSAFVVNRALAQISLGGGTGGFNPFDPRLTTGGSTGSGGETDGGLRRPPLRDLDRPPTRSPFRP